MNQAKYRIVVSTKHRPVAAFATTSDVKSAHAIADALRDAQESVEVWLWTRKQRKIITERGARWYAGYVLTGI